MIGKEYRTNKDMIGFYESEMWGDVERWEIHQWVRSAIHALQQLTFPFLASYL